MLVLVVEHNAETRKSASLLVEAAGHNCFSAQSETDAMSWLKTACPDLVLMDLLLPDSDHRQFSRAIQELLPTAKLVVLARAGADDAIQEAINWGAFDYLEKPLNRLRLNSILQHATQSKPASLVSKCLENAFFNGDQHLYDLALTKFKKALKLNIPIVVEGRAGTGKTTAIEHFLKKTSPELPLVWFNAATQDLENFSQSISELRLGNKSQRIGIIVQHLEAAGKELQHEIIKHLNTPNQIVITTSCGRLMDHMESGILDPTLFSKMSAAPMWLAPLDERPHDRRVIGERFLELANRELNTGLLVADSPLNTLADRAPFSDNLRGLKKSIFAAVARHTPMRQGIAHNPVQIVRESYSEPHSAGVPAINLLNEATGLKTIEIIEAEAIRFAFKHFEGRVGKIAKALKLGRTTLYRKLIKLDLAQSEQPKTSEQTDGFVHMTAEKVTAKAA